MEVGEVIIHARFAPNGSVVEISERPSSKTPTEWFNILCERVGTTYQPLSGGRGVFRLTRGKVDSLKAEVGSSAA
jgi:hypothetical protein